MDRVEEDLRRIGALVVLVKAVEQNEKDNLDLSSLLGELVGGDET